LQLTGARLSSRKQIVDPPQRPVLINPHPAFQKTIPPNAPTSEKNTEKRPDEVRLASYKV
jgi:hypothetical protein